MGQPAVDRLREYLRELKPGARALLIAELERNILSGGDGATASELILTELRRSFRGDDAKTRRFGDPARLFFQAIEPFLVDDVAEHMHRGRIARQTLEPIWQWLSNTVMPDEAKAYAEAVERALLGSDPDTAGQLADAFQTQAAARLQATLDAVVKNEKAQRQLGAQLGTSRAIADVQAVIDVLVARQSLAKLGSELPGHIKTFSGPSLENVKARLDALHAVHPNVLLYALVLVMNRMAGGWQMIRLAIKAAGSDDIARVAETPYGIAVIIVLAELERMIRELTADLRNGRGIAVAAMLKDVHDAMRGLRTELNLEPDSPWGRQLAAMRADISRLLSAEIEMVPGRVRRLLRPPKAGASNPPIDASEAGELESLVGLVVVCRNYASELAVNEVTQRAFGELQQFLDSGTRTLLEGLRVATDRDRAYRLSQVEVAVRFCGKAFGQEYATLLSKAAEVAAHGSEPVAARG